MLFVTGLLLSLITTLAILINPSLTQTLVDNVIVGVKGPGGKVIHEVSLLIPLLAVMVAVTLLKTALRYLMVLCFEHSSQYLVLTIRSKLYENLQRQEMHFYDSFRTGDLMTRLTGDLDMVRHTTSYLIFNLQECLILFVASLIYFSIKSWMMTLALFAITPLIFITAYLFSKKVRPVYIDLREKLSNLNTAAQENISGNRVVKSFHREAYETEKFKESNDAFRKANLKASYTWLKFFPVLESLAQSLTVITVLVGGLLIITGHLTYGELMAFSSLTWAISNPMRMLGMLLNDLQRFFASANKIIELFYARPTIADRHDAISFDGRAKGSIRFENVTFRYGKETVFENLDLEIEPGQTIGVMGPTGAGKTTLANLIARFYDVSSGAVLIDGIDVRRLKLDSLRSNIGMATQDVFLFSETIDGNIAYGNPELSEQKVHEYAKIADADEFVANMENGYETIIGERGVGLSGGQRQRLALARALAIEPPILILDDTTSAVDMETEKYIQQQLASLRFSCTKIIIAQRISSVKHADKIIILKDHHIAEQGTHEELLKRHGYYYSIYQLQQGEEAGFEKAGETVGTK